MIECDSQQMDKYQVDFNSRTGKHDRTVNIHHDQTLSLFALCVLEAHIGDISTHAETLQ